MSDSEEDCIETLKELYELNVLKGVKSPKYHHNASLLNRVSLWSVPFISGSVRTEV